jgi:hypothetical protein
VRVARIGGTIYLDLANEAWEAVEITSSGWRVVANPPVRFRRARGMRPLPRPVAGGSVDELRALVNVPDDAAWTLVKGWLVVALSGVGPYLILVVQGEQGSAKSTLSRVLRGLVDPSKAGLRSPPRNERDLAIAARNGHVVTFDNLSGLHGWLADALCRLAVGGGFGTRELWTDTDEALFEAARPLILNGIDDLLGRADLADRSVVVHLPRIADDRRRDEAALWAEFDRVCPRVLGALLYAVSVALANAHRVALPSLPRMADAAKWVAAAESALAIPAGGFLAALASNREEAVLQGLDADPVASAVQALLATQESWQGTATELLDVLSAEVPEAILRGRGTWPSTPSALGDRLKRVTPILRHVGIEVEARRGTHGRRMLALWNRSKPVTSVTPVTVASENRHASSVLLGAQGDGVGGGAVGNAAEPVTHGRTGGGVMRAGDGASSDGPSPVSTPRTESSGGGDEGGGLSRDLSRPLRLDVEEVEL